MFFLIFWAVLFILSVLVALSHKKQGTACRYMPSVGKNNGVFHACAQTCDERSREQEREIAKFKADALTLAARVGVLENQLKEANESTQRSAEFHKRAIEERDVARDRVEELETRLKEADESDDGVKVSFASARKSLTKAKLKQLREALEAAPDGAGFGGSVSVYDKKTKRLQLVQLTSKVQALEILSKAEKGNVDIVI